MRCIRPVAGLLAGRQGGVRLPGGFGHKHAVAALFLGAVKRLVGRAYQLVEPMFAARVVAVGSNVSIVATPRLALIES
jgi:hypothetical protein